MSILDRIDKAAERASRMSPHERDSLLKRRGLKPLATPAELEARRAACASCAERDESRGGLHCNLCRVCGDREPWKSRPRCPAFKWGRDAERMKAEAEAASEPTATPAGEPVLVSAVVPARDEGEEVAETCKSLLSAGVDEIVLVDDGSSDGSCGPYALRGLPAFWLDDMKAAGAEFGDEPLPRILVVRNAKPEGVGRARNQGARFAEGEVLLFADSHMRFDSDLAEFAQAARHRKAILCASVRPLREGTDGPGGKRRWTGYGAGFKLDKDGVAYKDKWIMRKPRDRFGRIDALIGACYAIPRSVFERIGGWVATRQWGYNEQALSMKAWFAGVDMFVDTETIVRHRFKKKFKYPVSQRGSLVNRWHVHAVVFDHDTFESYWAPKFTAAYGPGVAEDARSLISEPSVQAETKAFKSAKVRPDSEWFSAFGPETKESSDAYTA